MSEFPGAPRMPLGGRLTPEQERELFAKLRAARAEFDAHGGRECHCGGLIYPGERYTCTHGPSAPLTRAEIGAIRDGWREAGNSPGIPDGSRGAP